MIRKGTWSLKRAVRFQEEQQGWVPRAKETGPVALGISPLPRPVCVFGTIPWSLLHTPTPRHTPNLTSEDDETNARTGESH